MKTFMYSFLTCFWMMVSIINSSFNVVSPLLVVVPTQHYYYSRRQRQRIRRISVLLVSADTAVNAKLSNSNACCWPEEQQPDQQRPVPVITPQTNINNNNRTSLKIIYEDDDMLAIDKPAGVPVQYSTGSVESAVAVYLNQTTGTRTTNNTSSYIVHRLDKGTSGILLIGKHYQAARALKMLFEQRRVQKTYLAIADGFPGVNMSKLVTSRTKGDTKVEPEPSLTQKKLSKVIKNCGRNYTAALNLLHESASSSLDDPISPSCYSAAISVCRRAGKRDLAVSLLYSMLEQQPPPSSISTTMTTTTSTNVMIQQEQKPPLPNLLSFKTVLSLCAMEPPLSDTTLDLVLVQMPKCGFVDLNPHCVSSAIVACGRAGNLQDSLRLLEMVTKQQEDGCRVVEEACQRAAIQACKRCSDYEMAQQLQAQLDKNSFNPLQTQRPNVDQLLGQSILVNASIGKVGPRLMGVVNPNNGREACSIVTPLAFRNGQSYNRVVIETGRTHQIRVHMQHLDSPLVGDTM